MRCSKCGHDNREGRKFCTSCGTPLVAACPKCGAPIEAGESFCGECGGALGDRAAATVLDPTPIKAPAAERRHLTVLFCDLVGSTQIASRLDAEDWREIATQYQRMAAAVVTRFGGHVAKYLGDGLMVYFGWPEAHEDNGERAVRSALAIIDELAALNDRLDGEHKVRLSVRVGIQTGSVVMGEGGGKETDIFGDAPNIASRLQAAAEPDSVLITAAVHELVSGLFVVEDRGEQQLKGIEHPIQVYRVIRRTVARRRTHGAATRVLTSFVGREDEMQVLLNRWERVREGKGQLVFVVGEPGIGKSRLVEEFRARVRNQPHLWIECAGEQLSQGTPFHAVTQMLNGGLGWHGDESSEDRVDQLERFLELAGLKVSEALPLIAEMLNLPIPDKYSAVMFVPDQRRRRLLANLTLWVLNTTRVQPVVIAMEDLHWVDPSTLELAQTLVEQAPTTPLMLLYTARPEFHSTWSMRAHHAHVTLSRLNDRHTLEMVVGVMAQAALAHDLIDAVVKRTDGVPLFAEELTRLVLEGVSRSVAHAIPATLHDSLTARLDRLGPAKDVAQVGAVIGREFSYELLQAVAQMGDTELQSALAKLVDAELVYARGMPPEATYQFKHALIKDAAYEALLKTRRKELHRRVAQTITERFDAVAERQPELIARHWTEAGERELALNAWRIAADAAFERHAFKEAEEAYRQALTILGTLPESRERDERELQLIIPFVHGLQLTRGWAASEAAAAGARAQALAAKTDNLAHLVLQTGGLVAAVVTRGDLPAASAAADQLLDVSTREGSPGALGVAHALGSRSLTSEAT